jgi:hypothetical protein
MLTIAGGIILAVLVLGGIGLALSAEKPGCAFAIVAVFVLALLATCIG